ncbi:hypothetical protein [Polaribacter sp.]|uniref:hypothetical protein n=1 Tax=Polaribacter sp. TaxID=1920175 RepID=UPI003F6BCC12
MKSFLALCSILFLSCSNDFGIEKSPINTSQKATIKTFGGAKNDVFNAIKKTADGGYIIAGYTQSNNADVGIKTNTSFDFWVQKYNAQNSLEWQKTFGGSNDDRAADIIQTSDGNFAVLGYTTSSDVDVSANAGAQDFWLIKISATGNLLWEKTYGFSGADYGTKLLETSAGGFILTGVLDVTASGGQGNAKSNSVKHAGGDYWVIKTDNAGTLKWSKYFGGSFTDTPLGVVETADNHYLIAGSSDSNDFNITNNKGSYDYWVTKVSNSGILVWEKSFGGSEIDEARAITTTNDGDFIIAGDTRSSDKDVTTNNGAADVWAVKISTEGNLIWQKTYGGTSFDAARAISKTEDNGFLIAGSSRSLDNNFENKGQNDALILKIDANGNLQSQQTFGGSEIDFLYGITQLNNNTIIAVGESSSSDQDISENKGFTDALKIILE